MDFSRSQNENSGPLGDLELDPSTNDFNVHNDENRNVLEELKEIFEMSPGDDIDFPELHSRQRLAQNSDTRRALLQRAQNARQLVQSHPDVDPESVETGFDGDLLRVSYRLQGGVQPILFTVAG